MVYTHYIGHTHTHVFMNTGTCLSPPSIANGRIVSVDPDAVTTNPDRYEQGSVATYTCSSGYILVGTSQRTCESNGQWSGSQNPPTCKRKKTNIPCKLTILSIIFSIVVDCMDNLNLKYGGLISFIKLFKEQLFCIDLYGVRQKLVYAIHITM